jgi:hypothetical protein
MSGEIDPLTGEPVGYVPPKPIDPKTGEPVGYDAYDAMVASAQKIQAQGKPPEGFYKKGENPVMDNIRAAAEALLPIIRPITAVKAAAFPNIKTFQDTNMYKDKKGVPLALAAASDVLGTASNVLMPAKGVLAQAAKFGLPALMGVAFKNLSDTAMKNKGVEAFSKSDAGKVIGDYIMPGTSILLSGMGLSGALKSLKPAANVADFMEKNPNAGNDMFDNVNKINESNVAKGLKEAGFDSAKGNRAAVDNALEASVKKGIQKVKDHYETTFSQLKDFPVSKQQVKQLIADMEASKPINPRTTPDKALVKDLDYFINEAKKLKNPTVESIDKLKQDWRNETMNPNPSFTKPYSQTIASDIGNKIGTAAETALPPALQKIFKDLKGEYATMAEARADADFISKAPTGEIVKRLNNGDKIQAISKLADPELLNAALKADSHFKFRTDPAGMMNDYLKKLANIDSVNTELANKLFNPKSLPVYINPKSAIAGRFATAPETLSVEAQIASKKLDENRKKGLQYVK